MEEELHAARTMCDATNFGLSKNCRTKFSVGKFSSTKDHYFEN